MNTTLLITLIPLLPLLGFAVIALNSRKMAHSLSATIACGSVLIGFILAVLLFVNLLNGAAPYHVDLFDWITAGTFSVRISFLIDPLSSLMLLVITGVGFLIHVYSIGYMHDDAGFNRFFSYLNLFVFFMLLLVMGDNYLLMFVGWEGVGLCSYLLIGFWFKNQSYNNAANKAFIMNRIGDLGLIIGVIMIFVHFGSLNYENVFADAATIPQGELWATLVTGLLFIGAMGKSAQIPLYTWLPDAMAGPTPVSALIHAATMVTAGVYMVARNNILYSLSPLVMEMVLFVGLATALFAATIALTQNDIKKVLAYSTVSQLGLMFVALGVGAFSSGIFHMATHAFFKALLFLGAGSVIHALHGEQDIRQMGGLRKYIPVTFITFFIAVLAISGIPPFAGFFSKDEILAHAFEHSPVIWGIALAASLLTAFYMFRLLFLVFYGKERSSTETLHHIHESPRNMTVPLMVLAALSILGGFMGVPEALSGNNWIAGFLSPVFETSAKLAVENTLSHSMEYTLMATTVGLTIVVIAIAYARYNSKAHVPAADGQPITSLHKIILNKYYVDEIYEAVIVKPLFWLSGKLESIVEKSGIDAIVNSLGISVKELSKVLRLLQNGSIGYYIFVMVIGVLLILSYSFLK